MKYAVIDVGSNTVRLCVYDVLCPEKRKFKTHHEPQNHGGFGGIYRRWGVFRRRYKAEAILAVKMHKACELFVARPH